MAIQMLIAVAVALVISFIGTWVMIRLAPALKIIDNPNERSSHARPTPRGGGLAIVAAVMAAAWLMPANATDRWWLSLAAALPIALMGLLDDRYGLSAPLRLGLQLAAALAYAIAVTSGMTAPVAAIPLLLGVFGIAWACNLFNFMDGIDGIAGMQALFICAVAGWLLWPHAATLAGLLWIVAAAAAGFLMWNWAPARIFMGDVGSGFLGFLIAAIAFLTIARGLISLPVWVILWTLFLADTGVALTRRVLRGERWWTAHRSHAYQQLSRQWGSHAKVVITYAVLDLLIIMPGAWFAHTHAGASWWLCAALLGIGAGFAYSCNAWSAPNN